MPIFKEVRKRLDDEALLVIPDHFTGEQIKELYGDLSGFSISRRPYEALLKGKFAFICSGTATLEAALIGTPLALAYIAKPLDYHIARAFAHIDKVGLANILLGDVHPEYLQDAVTPQNLLAAYRQSDPQAFLQKSKALRAHLGHGSAQTTAQVING